MLGGGGAGDAARPSACCARPPATSLWRTRTTSRRLSRPSWLESALSRRRRTLGSSVTLQISSTAMEAGGAQHVSSWAVRRDGGAAALAGGDEAFEASNPERTCDSRLRPVHVLAPAGWQRGWGGALKREERVGEGRVFHSSCSALQGLGALQRTKHGQ